MPISRGQMPRQMYGLGSFVKKAIKGVTGAVKKIAGSGLGKAALLGLGGAGLMGMGPLSALGGLGASSGTGIASILSKGKSLLGGLTTGQRLAGSLGLAALASAPQEVQEESSRDIGALRKYLASYYENLGYSADEIAENVARDTAEYTSGAGGYAEGGRIGYREGDLAMGPGPGFTLKPPGELAYDATNTDIYGSSAASFTPKTIMNQLGNQVQAVNGPVSRVFSPGTGTIYGEMMPSRLPPETPVSMQTPLAGSGSISEIDMPIAGGNNNAGGILPVMPLFDKSGFRLGDQRYGTDLGGGQQMALPVMPPNNFPTDMRYRDPGPGIGTGGNLEEAYLAAQKSAQEQRQKGFLGQAILPGEMSFEDFKNSNSFTQQALPALPAQKMPFAQQVNSSSPMAQIAGMADGGRMGFAMGNPEENAIQASGIMNLPLNENPAGITELDLRETGGFIPPVGVKEKADDIPAMLSNNEFVFTADAVRGMGDGNVNKGAQRMYDMMKKLEKGGRV